jgi:hypothetical protein
MERIIYKNNTNFAQGHYDGITIGLLDNAKVSCLKNINLCDIHAVQVPAVQVLGVNVPVHAAESTEQGETETEEAGEEK